MPAYRVNRANYLRARQAERSRKMVTQPVRTYVKRTINKVRNMQENVIVDVAENTASDATGEAVFDLSALAISTANDKLEISSVQGIFRILNPASAGTVFVRVVIFQWYIDDNVDVPAKDDIIQGAEDNLRDVLKPLHVANQDNSVKFKVLFDKLYKLGEATSVEGNEKKAVKFLITPKKLGRKYMLGTGSAVGKNKIYMMSWSDVADASTPPTIEQASVCRFRAEA